MGIREADLDGDPSGGRDPTERARAVRGRLREGLARVRAVLVRWVLPPALLVAAAILALWMYRTSVALEQLGERSVVASTVLLAREKVDRVEQLIIAYDHAALHLVNSDDLEPLALRWSEAAGRVAPTVRSVLVLDEALRVVRHVSRDTDANAQRFRTIFFRSVLPLLNLREGRIGGHSHLHETIEGTQVLVTAQAREVAGRRHYVVLEIDLEYVRTELLPSLFPGAQESQHFNVLDDVGHLVFGKPLRGAGDYVVSRHFPTTLYKWQLSAVPQSAGELEAARLRRKRLNEGVLVSAALAVLLLGVAWLAYAARNERRLNALKSDFIATVSHELKTPLSLIRMFGEMLSTGRVASDDKRKQYLEIIVRESERLTALIENVLDFAKLERGKAAYEFSPANLGDVVTRTVELFRVRLEREKPAIVARVSEGIPRTMLDERALQLLLINLLDNAVKYAGESDVIEVRARVEGRAQVLEVEDQGPGLDEDDARRIFERFYRGRTGRSGQARGSGIGLALVKHIAEAHGGTAAVPRPRERGSGFVVSLPMRAVPRD